MDPERTTSDVEKVCGTCGEVFGTLYGIEVHFNTHEPRIPGKGLYVKAEQLKGTHIFRVAEFPQHILCTDPVKEFIETQGFTNVSFWEFGEVS